MKNEKLIRSVAFGFGAVLLLILAFIAIIYMIIFTEVRNTCDRAIAAYQKDCVDSLVLVLESEDKSVKEKNDAIWALGQIADKRALPVLEKLYTGEIPEREPLDKVISQYEIEKSIHWINEGNWTSWMYLRIR